MKLIYIFLLSILCLNSYAQEKLITPTMVNEKPSAGKRVKVVPKEHLKTDLFYSLYLPKNYNKEKSYPVIVEYTGNYYPPTQSTGNLKDASLGYAIAQNIDAIWICLPYVTKEYKQSLKWWGNEHNTIDYALKNIKDVCLEYNGNSGQIFIIGFSRGAIAVNYLGLHNDTIADVWRGFFSHDHYDGQRKWGKYWAKDLDSYRAAAKVRAKRLNGRASLISNNRINGKKYIDGNGITNYGVFTYIKPDIEKATKGQNLHPHNDLWMHTQLEDAQKVFSWFKNTLESPVGVYTISGTVTTKKGKTLSGIIVNAGGIHFGITNAKGAYKIEGITKSNRTIHLENSPTKRKEVTVNQDIYNLNFVIAE
ncbi:hypothetical protein [Wenyingzhuangia sp. IMCC45574]